MGSSQEKICLRHVELQDLARVLELAGELGYEISPAEGEQRLQFILADEEQLLLAAEMEDGRITGWVHASTAQELLAGRTVELHGLVVGETWRSRGIGELLLQEVENWGRSRGCAQVLVRSNVIRERAHQFYLRRGFHETKRQVILYKSLSEVEG